jgi:glycosyltransferase involved in cell wall biosynthesis
MHSKLLYLDSYTLEEGRSTQVPSSMSIGYGITSSGSLRDGLQECGFELTRPLADVSPFVDGSRESRLRWVVRGYERIVQSVRNMPPDLIFFFHSFNTFPVEVRRALQELSLHIPMVGYTHGSHWDKTDLVRLSRYPGLEYLDLANLLTLDRVLFDSNYILRTVAQNVSEHSRTAAESIEAKARVVGLPVATRFIDSCRTTNRFSRRTVVYNHSPVASKNPAEFIEVIGKVMARYEVDVLFTRSFKGEQVNGSVELRELRRQFDDRVILGDDLNLKDYFRALWMADIQVSTAQHESFGIATLEAMYTENCCLLPTRGSYPEICSGNSEILYKSIDDLERRLSYFIERPEEARRVGGALRNEARRYSERVVIPLVVDVLDEMLIKNHRNADDR